MRPIMYKIFLISLTSVLLLSGCSSYDRDIDLTPSNIETTTTTAATTAEVTTSFPLLIKDYRSGDCFIAPDPETNPSAAEVYDSYDCTVGYVYYVDKVRPVERRLLVDKKFKAVGIFQTNLVFYGITEENELLKVNKSDGSYEIVYTSQNGNITELNSSLLVTEKNGVYLHEKGRLLYIVDGKDIVIMETNTGKYEIVHSDNGVVRTWWAGYQEEIAAFHEDAYICGECGYNGNYVIWEDNESNFFWYHPETGEIEQLKVGDDDVFTYFLQAELELPQSYMLVMEGDCFLATDDAGGELVPGYLYFNDKTLLLDKKFKTEVIGGGQYQDENVFIGVSEDNELIKVNKHDGSYEVMYTAQYGDIDETRESLMLQNKNGEDESGRLIYFKDGDNIVIMETATCEYNIVHCDNGISSFIWCGCQEDFIYNGTYDDVYVCENCGYDGNYVIWSDKDENWFWYHPETGENEPLKITNSVIPYFKQAD